MYITYYNQCEEGKKIFKKHETVTKTRIIKTHRSETSVFLVHPCSNRKLAGSGV